MNIQFAQKAAFAALLLVAFAGLLPAQTAVTTRVNVPFAFEAGGQSLPAGEYRLERAPNSNWVLYLYDINRNETVTVATTPGTDKGANAAPKLVFQRAGAALCLTEIHTGGNSLGYRVPMTKEQTALARATPAGRVELALAR